MKKLKNVLLSAAIILIAAGAAFATNASKDSEGTSVKGYWYDAVKEKCTDVGVQCSTTPGAICTWKDSLNVSHNLHSFIDETECDDDVLYRN